MFTPTTLIGRARSYRRVVLAATTFVLSGWVTAQASIDQFQLTYNFTTSLRDDAFQQDFTTQAESISGVDIFLDTAASPPEGTVTVRLRSGECESSGTILATSALFVVNPTRDVPTRFEFEPAVDVMPGNVYTIEVTSSSSAIASQYALSNVYSGGNFCQNSVAEENSDLKFATYDDIDSIGNCPPMPSSGCLSAGKSSLLIKDHPDSSKDRVLWKFSKMPNALDVQSAVGFLTSRAYAPLHFCLWDTTSDSPFPAMGFQLEAHTHECFLEDLECWSSIAKDTGYVYDREGGSAEGVGKFLIKGGDAGKGRFFLRAGGANFPMPTPFVDEFFESDPTVVMEMRSLGGGDCWQTTFDASSIKKNTESQFKGKAK